MVSFVLNVVDKYALDLGKSCINKARVKRLSSKIEQRSFAMHSYSDEVNNPIEKLEDLYDGSRHNETYDLLVFIGRFQPFHYGHKRVIDVALSKADKVLVLIGSSFRPARPRNPFSFYDRRRMIRSTYSHVPESKLIIEPLEDFTYRDEMWVKEVQELAAIHSDKKIGLIGCSKDHTSYYLKLFPQWGNVNVKFMNPLNSTEIREEIFSDRPVNEKESFFRGLVPPPVSSILVSYLDNTDQYLETKKYFSFCEKYKKKRQSGVEYPVQDITADAVVIQSGHVLLVERKAEPGKGLLALPGGYVNQNEKWFDSAIRELREETRIKVPEPVLRGSLVQQHIFDEPTRSERGRIVTQAFKIVLNDSTSLPQVKGGDDASKAFWMPLNEVKSDNMFEDHYDILQYFMR